MPDSVLGRTNPIWVSPTEIRRSSNTPIWLLSALDGGISQTAQWHSDWMALSAASHSRDRTDEQWALGDNAYESDRLDADLARCAVELIAPHRRTGHNGRKTVARCVATDGAGRSRATLCLVPEL